jgi:hypothetical protein
MEPARVGAIHVLIVDDHEVVRRWAIGEGLVEVERGPHRLESQA